MRKVMGITILEDLKELEDVTKSHPWLRRYLNQARSSPKKKRAESLVNLVRALTGRDTLISEGLCVEILETEWV